MLGKVVMLLTTVAVMAPSERSTDWRSHGMVQSVSSESTPGDTSHFCPEQCGKRSEAVMVCDQVDHLDTLQLIYCINRSRGLLLLDLGSWYHTCNCILLELAVRMLASDIIIFTPMSCALELGGQCGSELIKRVRTVHHAGLVAGLVMEQDDRNWRKATRQHMTRLWTAVNALPPGQPYDRYRNMTAQIAKTIRLTKRSMVSKVTKLLPLFREDSKLSSDVTTRTEDSQADSLAVETNNADVDEDEDDDAAEESNDTADAENDNDNDNDDASEENRAVPLAAIVAICVGAVAVFILLPVFVVLWRKSARIRSEGGRNRQGQAVQWLKEACRKLTGIWKSLFRCKLSRNTASSQNKMTGRTPVDDETSPLANCGQNNASSLASNPGSDFHTVSEATLSSARAGHSREMLPFGGEQNNSSSPAREQATIGRSSEVRKNSLSPSICKGRNNSSSPSNRRRNNSSSPSNRRRNNSSSPSYYHGRNNSSSPSVIHARNSSSSPSVRHSRNNSSSPALPPWDASVPKKPPSYVSYNTIPSASHRAKSPTLSSKMLHIPPVSPGNDTFHTLGNHKYKVSTMHLQSSSGRNIQPRVQSSPSGCQISSPQTEKNKPFLPSDALLALPPVQTAGRKSCESTSDAISYSLKAKARRSVQSASEKDRMKNIPIATLRKSGSAADNQEINCTSAVEKTTAFLKSDKRFGKIPAASQGVLNLKCENLVENLGDAPCASSKTHAPLPKTKKRTTEISFGKGREARKHNPKAIQLRVLDNRNAPASEGKKMDATRALDYSTPKLNDTSPATATGKSDDLTISLCRERHIASSNSKSKRRTASSAADGISERRTSSENNVSTTLAAPVTHEEIGFLSPSNKKACSVSTAGRSGKPTSAGHGTKPTFRFRRRREKRRLSTGQRASPLSTAGSKEAAPSAGHRNLFLFPSGERKCDISDLSRVNMFLSTSLPKKQRVFQQSLTTSKGSTHVPTPTTKSITFSADNLDGRPTSRRQKKFWRSSADALKSFSAYRSGGLSELEKVRSSAPDVNDTPQAAGATVTDKGDLRKTAGQKQRRSKFSARRQPTSDSSGCTVTWSMCSDGGAGQSTPGQQETCHRQETGPHGTTQPFDHEANAISAGSRMLNRRRNRLRNRLRNSVRERQRNRKKSAAAGISSILSYSRGSWTQPVSLSNSGSSDSDSRVPWRDPPSVWNLGVAGADHPDPMYSSQNPNMQASSGHPTLFPNRMTSDGYPQTCFWPLVDSEAPRPSAFYVPNVPSTHQVLNNVSAFPARRPVTSFTPGQFSYKRHSKKPLTIADTFGVATIPPLMTYEPGTVASVLTHVHTSPSNEELKSVHPTISGQTCLHSATDQAVLPTSVVDDSSQKEPAEMGWSSLAADIISPSVTKEESHLKTSSLTGQSTAPSVAPAPDTDQSHLPVMIQPSLVVDAVDPPSATGSIATCDQGRRSSAAAETVLSEHETWGTFPSLSGDSPASLGTSLKSISEAKGERSLVSSLVRTENCFPPESEINIGPFNSTIHVSNIFPPLGLATTESTEPPTSPYSAQSQCGASRFVPSKPVLFTLGTGERDPVESVVKRTKFPSARRTSGIKKGPIRSVSSMSNVPCCVKSAIEKDVSPLPISKRLFLSKSYEHLLPFSTAGRKSVKFALNTPTKVDTGVTEDETLSTIREGRMSALSVSSGQALSESSFTSVTPIDIGSQDIADLPGWETTGSSTTVPSLMKMDVSTSTECKPNISVSSARAFENLPVTFMEQSTASVFVGMQEPSTSDQTDLRTTPRQEDEGQDVALPAADGNSDYGKTRESIEEISSAFGNLKVLSFTASKQETIRPFRLQQSPSETDSFFECSLKEGTLYVDDLHLTVDQVGRALDDYLTTSVEQGIPDTEGGHKGTPYTTPTERVSTSLGDSEQNMVDRRSELSADTHGVFTANSDSSVILLHVDGYGHVSGTCDGNVSEAIGGDSEALLLARMELLDSSSAVSTEGCVVALSVHELPSKKDESIASLSSTTTQRDDSLSLSIQENDTRKTGEKECFMIKKLFAWDEFMSKDYVNTCERTETDWTTAYSPSPGVSSYSCTHNLGRITSTSEESEKSFTESVWNISSAQSLQQFTPCFSRELSEILLSQSQHESVTAGSVVSPKSVEQADVAETGIMHDEDDSLSVMTWSGRQSVVSSAELLSGNSSPTFMSGLSLKGSGTSISSATGAHGAFSGYSMNTDKALPPVASQRTIFNDNTNTGKAVISTGSGRQVTPSSDLLTRTVSQAEYGQTELLCDADEKNTDRETVSASCVELTVPLSSNQRTISDASPELSEASAAEDWNGIGGSDSSRSQLSFCQEGGELEDFLSTRSSSVSDIRRHYNGTVSATSSDQRCSLSSTCTEKKPIRPSLSKMLSSLDKESKVSTSTSQNRLKTFPGFCPGHPEEGSLESGQISRASDVRELPLPMSTASEFNEMDSVSSANSVHHVDLSAASSEMDEPENIESVLTGRPMTDASCCSRESGLSAERKPLSMSSSGHQCSAPTPGNGISPSSCDVSDQADCESLMASPWKLTSAYSELTTPTLLTVDNPDNDRLRQTNVACDECPTTPVGTCCSEKTCQSDGRGIPAESNGAEKAYENCLDAFFLSGAPVSASCLLSEGYLVDSESLEAVLEHLSESERFDMQEVQKIAVADGSSLTKFLQTQSEPCVLAQLEVADIVTLTGYSARPLSSPEAHQAVGDLSSYCECWEMDADISTSSAAMRGTHATTVPATPGDSHSLQQGVSSASEIHSQVQVEAPQPKTRQMRGILDH